MAEQCSNRDESWPDLTSYPDSFPNPTERQLIASGTPNHSCKTLKIKWSIKKWKSSSIQLCTIAPPAPTCDGQSLIVAYWEFWLHFRHAPQEKVKLYLVAIYSLDRQVRPKVWKNWVPRLVNTYIGCTSASRWWNNNTFLGKVDSSNFSIAYHHGPRCSVTCANSSASRRLASPHLTHNAKQFLEAAAGHLMQSGLNSTILSQDIFLDQTPLVQSVTLPSRLSTRLLVPLLKPDG